MRDASEQPAGDEHECYFVFAGTVIEGEGEDAKEYEIERCANPKCGEERRRGA